MTMCVAPRGTSLVNTASMPHALAFVPNTICGFNRSLGCSGLNRSSNAFLPVPGSAIMRSDCGRRCGRMRPVMLTSPTSHDNWCQRNVSSCGIVLRHHAKKIAQPDTIRASERRHVIQPYVDTFRGDDHAHGWYGRILSPHRITDNLLLHGAA